MDPLQTSTVEVSVLFFARARELTGAGQVKLHVSKQATGAALLGEIVQAYPGLAALVGSVVLALNEEYMDMDAQPQSIHEGDTLAVLYMGDSAAERRLRSVTEEPKASLLRDISNV